MVCSGISLTANTAGAAGIASALLLSTMPVFAHTAPTGWDYPISCCSNFDCREVSDAVIVESPEGYVIKTTGEVIPMTSRKVRPSPDGLYHWCSVAGKRDGATICLFVPPRAF